MRPKCFAAGLSPKPHWGSLQCPLAGGMGLTVPRNPALLSASGVHRPRQVPGRYAAVDAMRVELFQAGSERAPELLGAAGASVLRVNASVD